MTDHATLPDDAARIAQLEAELARARRQIDDTRAELDDFAYSVSHDLRGPLRALNGFSKLLGEEAADLLTEETSDYLLRIVGATRRLESLLEDLLALSRAGRAPMHVERLDLGRMAADVAASLGAAAGERQVEWRFADSHVEADPLLMRSILEHLIGNALKFSRPREHALIELVADTAGAAAGATVTRFSIRDNGTGLDMSYADRLFSPFQRLHPANAYEGNGIGLALVKRIVRRHGGRVWLTATPDAGAEIFVSLWENERPPGR